MIMMVVKKRNFIVISMMVIAALSMPKPVSATLLPTTLLPTDNEKSCSIGVCFCMAHDPYMSNTLYENKTYVEKKSPTTRAECNAENERLLSGRNNKKHTLEPGPSPGDLLEWADTFKKRYCVYMCKYEWDFGIYDPTLLGEPEYRPERRPEIE